MLTFEWYGQACFKIQNSSTVVTDPHDGKAVGLKPPPGDTADIITISHEHFDHASGEDLVAKEGAITVRESGESLEKGVEIKGIDSFHDRAEGAKRGENVIFVLELEGLRICHLGDLGHHLSEQKLEEIGAIDVLLAPVGGNYTIDGREAAALAEQLDPQVVIPMHFRVEGLEVDIAGPEEFLQEIVRSYAVEERERLELDGSPGRKLAVQLACLAC